MTPGCESAAAMARTELCDKGQAALSPSKGHGEGAASAWPRRFVRGEGSWAGADPFGLKTEIHSHEKAKTQPADSRPQCEGSESLVQGFTSSG